MLALAIIGLAMTFVGNLISSAGRVVERKREAEDMTFEADVLKTKAELEEDTSRIYKEEAKDLTGEMATVQEIADIETQQKEEQAALYEKEMGLTQAEATVAREQSKLEQAVTRLTAIETAASAAEMTSAIRARAGVASLGGTSVGRGEERVTRAAGRRLGILGTQAGLQGKQGQLAYERGMFQAGALGTQANWTRQAGQIIQKTAGMQIGGMENEQARLRLSAATSSFNAGIGYEQASRTREDATYLMGPGRWLEFAGGIFGATGQAASQAGQIDWSSLKMDTSSLAVGDRRYASASSKPWSVGY